MHQKNCWRQIINRRFLYSYPRVLALAHMHTSSSHNLYYTCIQTLDCPLRQWKHTQTRAHTCKHAIAYIWCTIIVYNTFGMRAQITNAARKKRAAGASSSGRCSRHHYIARENTCSEKNGPREIREITFYSAVSNESIMCFGFSWVQCSYSSPGARRVVSVMRGAWTRPRFFCVHAGGSIGLVGLRLSDDLRLFFPRSGCRFLNFRIFHDKSRVMIYVSYDDVSIYYSIILNAENLFLTNFAGIRVNEV